VFILKLILDPWSRQNIETALVEPQESGDKRANDQKSNQPRHLKTPLQRDRARHVFAKMKM